MGISEEFNARLGFNWFSFEDDDSYSDIDYDYDINLLNVPLVLDWHPGGKGFRISAGILINGNDLEMTGKSSSGSYNIGDTTYSAVQVGALKADVDFNSVAPYIGIGYGNAVGKDKRWSFVLDLGVAFQGSPDVAISANGSLSSDPAFQADLERERASLENDLDDYKFYPVIMVGVSYKF